MRLAHINAPEISTNDGKLAKAFVEDWLEVRPVILVETIKDRREKYGRYLAVIYDPTNTGKSLNTLLVEKGMAVPYEGGAR